jgi:hypothetical protein
MFNPDFKDMFSALSAHKVEFLVVGAYAMATHGLPRSTGDLDLWINPTENNASRVMSALAEFGAPMSSLSAHDLSTPGMVFQIGLPPYRIDLLTAIDGVNFAQAFENRVRIAVESIEVPVIGRKDLLANKRATGRPKDRLDADWLEKQS